MPADRVLQQAVAQDDIGPHQLPSAGDCLKRRFSVMGDHPQVEVRMSAHAWQRHVDEGIETVNIIDAAGFHQETMTGRNEARMHPHRSRGQRQTDQPGTDDRHIVSIPEPRP